MVVFFDLDGTIVDTKTLYIPPSAIRTVQALREKGHIPVVNTGRPYAHIDPRIRELPFSGWICGCGMEILFNGSWLYRRRPDEALQAFVRQKVAEFGILPLYECADGALVYDPERLAHPKQKLELEQMKSKGFPIRTVSEHPDFMKFVTWCLDQEAAEKFHQAMEPYFEVITRGKDGFTEFVLKGSSKAGGMLELLKALDIPQSETLAIGDSTNDLPMFQTAAHSVCMGSGMEEAKLAAEYVTAPLLEDGVEKAMAHYGLI